MITWEKDAEGMHFATAYLPGNASPFKSGSVDTAKMKLVQVVYFGPQCVLLKVFYDLII